MRSTLLAGDTICAIATGTGGAIGVVRVSGPLSEVILRRLAPALPPSLESHRLQLATARDPDDGEVLDQVLACVMRAPGSYTGETVVELQAHGGEANLGRLLRAVVRCGARVAEPGEFTRRAFLAGRIDLARAEAVAELIAARSERAARLAQAQLRGSVSDAVAALRARAVAALAEIEASVDFPAEPLDFAGPDALAAGIEAASREIDALAASHRHGRLVSEGIDVAIVGRANAGKSSLLNALAGEERALVDAAPGTTRDFLEVELNLAGMRVVLVDTAGERDEPAELERRGIELARRRRERADVTVVVIDGAAGFGRIEEDLCGGEAGRSRPLVLAWHKCDLRPPGEAAGVPAGLPLVRTSARTGEGLRDLAVAIREAAGDTGTDEGVTVTSARQRALLASAASEMARGAAVLRAGAPPELVAVDLRQALRRLDEITGETFDGSVLDRIFARFCIGK